MLPAILGLGGLTAKIIATAVIPRVVRAISQSFSATRPAEPCPSPAVEGISSAPETAPAPVLSGVSATRIKSRKWGYAGLWHHAPSGLDLATYRLYDAKNRRWISRDPLGEGVDYNLYRYCGNNPVSNVDPSGLYLVITYKGVGDLTDFLRRLGIDIRKGKNSRGRFELSCSDGTSGRLKEIIENASPINFDLDDATFVGGLTSTSTQTVDVNDLRTLENSGVPSNVVNSLLQHELDEGFRAQTGDRTLSSDAAWNTHHPNALGADSRALAPNWSRGPDGPNNTLNYSERTPSGTVNHTLQIQSTNPLQVIWH